MKTYRTAEAEKYFENERNAYKRLRYSSLPHANIIGYYGSFNLDGSYNIILEYADLGTLNQYMGKTHEPTSSGDIMMFWERFLAILQGLIQIHNTPGAAVEGPRILLGYMTPAIFSVLEAHSSF